MTYGMRNMLMGMDVQKPKQSATNETRAEKLYSVPYPVRLVPTLPVVYYHNFTLDLYNYCDLAVTQQLQCLLAG